MKVFLLLDLLTFRLLDYLLEVVMHLYIIRHGDAKSKEEDPGRSLSEKGVAAVEKIGSLIEDHIFINVKSIFHSTKPRSQQTAKILSMYVEPPDGLKESEDLDPMADPQIWADEIKKHTDDVIIVGHLPHIDRLGTSLYQPKFAIDDGRRVKYVNAGAAGYQRGRHYDFEAFDRIFTVPYKPNTALLFLSVDGSFHGVEPTPADRMTLQYQVVNADTTFAKSRGVQ